MAKLRNAIQNTKDQAKANITESMSDIEKKKYINKFKEYSFEYSWNVENCAEIWAARNAILNGAKFDNLIIKSVYKSDLEIHELCKNCKCTFKGHYIID